MKYIAVLALPLLLTAVLYSQAKPTPNPKYRIVSCLDLKEWADTAAGETRVGQRPSPDPRDECSVALNDGSEPVLYMGRSHEGKHLVLVKTQ
jgi:hypothetical protein